MPRILIISDPSVLNKEFLASEIGMEVVVNTAPEIDDVISIFDLDHEDSVNDRWPDQCYIVGDTMSKWKGRARMQIPEDKADMLLVEALRADNIVGGGEDEDVN